MLIIPAIDLKDGAVVRYVQGHLDKKVYSRDPIKTAKHWERQGAKMLHVVDLDGAFSGVPSNLSVVKSIGRELKIPVQFGGGVRTLEIIKDVFASGVSRVVLGTKAFEDKNFLRKAISGFKEKIIVSIDTKNNKIMSKGWKSQEKGLDVLEFVQLLKDLGLKEIIYTDVTKDGALKGPNIKDLKALLKSTGMRIIASGGVSSLDDINKLKILEKQGLSGIIIGKALYEGRFTLAQALKL